VERRRPPSLAYGAVELRCDHHRSPLLRCVGGLEGRDDVGTLSRNRGRVVDEQLAHSLAERLAADLVRERGQGVGSDAGTFDKGADHRLTRERRAAEDPRVEDGRVDRVRADQGTSLAGR
jgi:hypothetical protein